MHSPAARESARSVATVTGSAGGGRRALAGILGPWGRTRRASGRPSCPRAGERGAPRDRGAGRRRVSRTASGAARRPPARVWAVPLRPALSDRAPQIGHADYAFSIDVDCLFVAPVGAEVRAWASNVRRAQDWGACSRRRRGVEEECQPVTAMGDGPDSNPAQLANPDPAQWARALDCFPLASVRNLTGGVVRDGWGVDGRVESGGFLRSWLRWSRWRTPTTPTTTARSSCRRTGEFNSPFHPVHRRLSHTRILNTLATEFLCPRIHSPFLSVPSRVMPICVRKSSSLGRRNMSASGQPPGTMWMQEDVAAIFREQRGCRRRRAAHTPIDRQAERGAEDGGHLRPRQAVYERRPESEAAVPLGSGRRYYYAGLYGGRAAEFLSLSMAVARRTEADFARGIVARVRRLARRRLHPSFGQGLCVAKGPPCLSLHRCSLSCGYDTDGCAGESGA